MKKTKILLACILTAVLLLTQLGVMTFANSENNNQTGTTVSADNGEYIVKFAQNQQNKLISCDEMTTLLGQPIQNGGEYETESTTDNANVAYNDDGSITLFKSAKQYGANLEVSVTADMRKAYADNTSHKMKVSFYLSKSFAANGLFADTQIRVYAKFKEKGSVVYNKDTYSSFLKLSSLGNVTAKAYQQYIDKEFSLLNFEGETLESLDDVESIIISLYHFDFTQATLEFSGIGFETTSPRLKAFTPPDAESADKSVVLANWRKDYDKKWPSHPSTVKYSTNYSSNTSDYSAFATGSLYLKNINDVDTKQLTIYYDFDRDQFNKAIVTANQENGSKKAYISINIPKLLDTNDKEMSAEFELQFFMLNGDIKTVHKQWLKGGYSGNMKFDISDIGINSVSYIKLSIQNYWKFCEADEKYYDYDKKQEKDGKIYCTDNEGKTNVDVTDKVLTSRVMKNVEAFISPIATYTASVDITTTNTTTKAVSTTTASSYKYSGYHFFDFSPQSLDECYGNNPSNIDFLYKDYYQRYAIDNHTYKNNNSAGTKQKGNSTYLADYNNALALSSGGYQLGISSGFEKVQAQYQSSFWASGKIEDENRTKSTTDHIKPLAPQNEKYDYHEQMANAVKYANQSPYANLKGYLAMDVYLISSVHGYKNSKNATYAAWCKNNKKECTDVISDAEIQLMIHAQDKDGDDCSVDSIYHVKVGQKTTLFIDVSDLDPKLITNVRVVAQNYGNLANTAQGGSNAVCGITNVSARYSAIYVPGANQAQLKTTTINVTVPLNKKDALKIKKLYDALPGLKVSDYETLTDYEKLTDFMRAWDNSSIATQNYCSKEYGIDYVKISMLESAVYDIMMSSGEYIDSNGDSSPSTGEIAFPVLSLLTVISAGIVIINTRKEKTK